MRKPAFCICENKGANKLHCPIREANQRLCFRYIDSVVRKPQVIFRCIVQQVFAVIKLRTTVINIVLFVVFIFMSFMIMKSDINKLGCILFVHLSSISLENFKDLALIIPEILELMKLHTYKFGLV